MFDDGKQRADINQVRYYFDAVRTDSLDSSGISRRNAELLSLRPALMKLTDDEFESVIRGFWGVLNGVVLKPQEGKSSNHQTSYRDARRLYEDSYGPSGGPVSEIGHV